MADNSSNPNIPTNSCPECPTHLTHKIVMAAMSVYLTLTMTVLDGNIVNVALPEMAKSFGVSRSAVVWVENSYLLIITMLILPFAALGDRWGYKKVFLWGIGIFTVGSAICSVVPGFALLLGARALEGIGAAGIMSVNIPLIRIIYPPKLLGRGMAWNAIIVGAATALGPTLAGAILSVGSWHWLFAINIPIGIAALAVGVKHLPEVDLRTACERRQPFDKVSAVESALVFGLSIAVLEGFSHPGSHLLEWIGLGVLVVVAWAFIRRELHMKAPMLAVDLFKLPDFTVSMSSSMINFISTMLAMVSLPFFLKEDLGYDVLHVGLLISPWPIALIIASPIAGRLVNRINPSYLSAAGMGIAAVGLVTLWLVPQHCGFWDIAWRMAICGLGFGLFKTPNNVLMVKSSPVDRTGAAGGLKSASRLFGQCLGTALVAVIFRASTVAHSSRLCLLLAVITAVAAGAVSLIHLRHNFPSQQIPQH